MSAAAFPFTVGDKVRLARWAAGDHVVITAVGKYGFLAYPWYDLGTEGAHSQLHNWIRYGAVG